MTNNYRDGLTKALDQARKLISMMDKGEKITSNDLIEYLYLVSPNFVTDLINDYRKNVEIISKIYDLASNPR